MATELLEAPSETSADHKMIHVVCDCDPDIALCGYNVKDRPYTERDAECVVCVSMEFKPCLRCGQ